MIFDRVPENFFSKKEQLARTVLRGWEDCE